MSLFQVKRPNSVNFTLYTEKIHLSKDRGSSFYGFLSGSSVAVILLQHFLQRVILLISTFIYIFFILVGVGEGGGRRMLRIHSNTLS